MDVLEQIWEVVGESERTTDAAAVSRSTPGGIEWPDFAQGEAEDVAVDWPTSMILLAATASPVNAARIPETPSSGRFAWCGRGRSSAGPSVVRRGGQGELSAALPVMTTVVDVDVGWAFLARQVPFALRAPIRRPLRS